jgi:outer membrane lipoprotein-sorting protein
LKLSRVEIAYKENQKLKIKMQNYKLKFKNSVVVMKALIVLLVVVGTCWPGGCAGNLVGCEAKEAQKADANSVEVVLEKLKKQTGELKSYQSRIEYKFSQPLLESETLRKGVLYYQRAGGKSALRINFQTLKQDDEEEQKYIEQYIFDGVWLTHIDYQIKEVKRYQQAEPNQPVDAFELAKENFPIIGFSKAEDLKKEFEIKLVEQKPSVIPAQPVIPAQAGIQDFIRLHLKTKQDSIYKDDYTSIDFWIDKKLYLPAKIVAVSTEEDIYEIKLLNVKVNRGIDKKVFEVKIPQGFGVEITPLKKKEKN